MCRIVTAEVNFPSVSVALQKKTDWSAEERYKQNLELDFRIWTTEEDEEGVGGWWRTYGSQHMCGLCTCPTFVS